MFLGGGIGWKIFKCHQRQQRRKHLQQRINNLIDMHKKLLEISIIDPSNKTNLPINETDGRFTNFNSSFINENFFSFFLVIS